MISAVSINASVRRDLNQRFQIIVSASIVCSMSREKCDELIDGNTKIFTLLGEVYECHWVLGLGYG